MIAGDVRNEPESGILPRFHRRPERVPWPGATQQCGACGHYARGENRGLPSASGRKKGQQKESRNPERARRFVIQGGDAQQPDRSRDRQDAQPRFPARLTIAQLSSTSGKLNAEPFTSCHGRSDNAYELAKPGAVPELCCSPNAQSKLHTARTSKLTCRTAATIKRRIASGGFGARKGRIAGAPQIQRQRMQRAETPMHRRRFSDHAAPCTSRRIR
jgi:hypothetical protein